LTTSYSGKVTSTTGFKRWDHADQSFDQTGNRLSALLPETGMPASGMR
jgi:hypothetical protein